MMCFLLIVFFFYGSVWHGVRIVLIASCFAFGWLERYIGGIHLWMVCNLVVYDFCISTSSCSVWMHVW